MIRHMVHLRFLNSVSEVEREALFQKLSALQKEIDGIIEFKKVVNVSVEEPLVRGFIDAFWFDFVDANARDHYLTHPEHVRVAEELVQCLDGGLEGVFVCDFEL
ncbi:Dabb family protein [Endozoicomonas arenosclerae]|uniref:Dabb family protein n=1 Tax=Endozoicomonas arenosclerae TaxID=1633495 RepID=UPI000785C3BD|nr:Dabb family protein [Endozoicomonas arenosclerae]